MIPSAVEDPIPPVYRAPMRSRRAGVAEGAAVERALRLGVCGLGGIVTAESAARRVERFAAVPDGALVWTRDVDGLHWLGRLSGPLRYDGSRGAHEVDLEQVRDCRWMPAPVPDPLVPAAVLATFARGGRNWQQIHAAGIGEASVSLWTASGR